VNLDQRRRGGGNIRLAAMGERARRRHECDAAARDVRERGRRRLLSAVALPPRIKFVAPLSTR